jgi:hypothetical protein
MIFIAIKQRFSGFLFQKFSVGTKSSENGFSREGMAFDI